MTRYFKLDNNSDSGKKLIQLIDRINEARKVNMDFAHSIGAEVEGGILTDSFYVAGGIIGFKMKEVPSNWRLAKKGYYGYYYPKSGKENKELHKKIAELPKIQRHELREVIEMHSIFSSPGIIECHEFLLIEVPTGGFDGEYTPLTDMIEITGGAYIEAKKQKKGGQDE